MQEINRTEIATLGEFGLIKHLTKDIELKNPETQYGVGDDAAVLEFKDKEVLVPSACTSNSPISNVFAFFTPSKYSIIVFRLLSTFRCPGKEWNKKVPKQH